MKVFFLYSNNLQEWQRQKIDDKNNEFSFLMVFQKQWGWSISYILRSFVSAATNFMQGFQFRIAHNCGLITGTGKCFLLVCNKRSSTLM